MIKVLTAKYPFKRIMVLFIFLGFKTFAQETVPASGLFQLFVEEPGSKPFFSDKKGVFAKKGMVSSAHEVASNVGANMLKKGGNAIDAAVATHFALAVVFPFAGNLGGGGFAVVRDKNGHSYTLDFREKAPLAAHRDMYLDKDGNPIPAMSTLGHAASGIPGSVAGMVALHQKQGSLPWTELLQPAIELAEYGVVLTKREALGLNNIKELLLQVNGSDNQYFINKNGPWKEGDLLVQKDLAKTLIAIQKKKEKGFYSGWVAKALLNEMGQRFSKADLKGYHAQWRKPIFAPYKNFNIITMPPPSSGGIALMQLLKMIEPYPIKKWGWHADSTVQTMIEAERRVYADRAKWLGDPDFVKVPQDELISEGYLKGRMADFSFAKANTSAEISGGAVPGYESDETTHYSIVDAAGNAVAITTTLNGAYGSKVVVSGAGFLMNNEMDDFSIKAGVPNMFGLVGNKANEIAPGKRMLSSMTPTIVEKDGKLLAVVGTPGGSTIITSVFQTIVNVIEHGMTMQQSVNALKFHHQWLPDKTVFETNALKPQTVENLKAKGYIIEPQRGTLGRMDCILVHPDGTLEGASDPRADNTSVGHN